MGNYVSAGVYLKETDLSQIVAAASTSIGAIVGASKKGPVNVPVLVTSTKDFIDKFGIPNSAVSYMHYAALAFLEESNRLYVVRVPGSGYAYAGALLQTLTAGTISGLSTPFAGDPSTINFQTIGGVSASNENIGYFYAIGPGSYADTLGISITSKNLTAPINVVATAGTGGSLAAGSYSYKVTGYNSAGESAGSTAATVTVTAGGTAILTWNAIPSATGYKIYGRNAGQFQFIDSTANLTYTDTGVITPTSATAPATSAITPIFTVNVFDTSVSSIAPVEFFDVTLGAQTDGFGQQMEMAFKINTFSQYIRVVSNAAVFNGSYPTIFNMSMVQFSGGDSGAAVTDSQIVNGWQQFKDPESITVRLLINGGYSSPTVQLAMDTLAQGRKDCVAILDMPSYAQDVQSAVNYRNVTLNLNSNRSAIYSPDLKINDPYNDQVLFVPPSGHVAAVYARTDYVAQPWFAPAGLNRGQLNVLGLRYKYNQGDRDTLAPAQISYMRNFPGQGIAVWEQLTMQAKASALSYVNVRRLLDVIEISVEAALQYSVQEPDDDILGMRIVQMIGNFLQGVKNDRGVNNYLVVSDSSNNPPAVTGQAQRNVDVYVEPTIGTQKIQLQTVVTRQGASFQELVATGGNF